jgi:hypothetical protein
VNEQLATLLATIPRFDVVICHCCLGPHIDEKPNDNSAYAHYAALQNAIEKAYAMGFQDGSQITRDLLPS